MFPGTPAMEEMKLVLNLVRPRYFMPIHGEFRQLAKHARLAEHLRASGLEETFVMESGDVLEIDHHGARRAGKVSGGRVRIDSGSVDDVVEEMMIRDRQIAAKTLEAPNREEKTDLGVIKEKIRADLKRYIVK
jgi:ribonuclease J